jgi:hypothetical protein
MGVGGCRSRPEPSHQRSIGAAQTIQRPKPTHRDTAEAELTA